MPLLNHLREKFPWFPTIDIDLCRKDLQCLNACPHDVFEWDPQSGRPIVAHWLQCSPGCNICVENCDTGAISLPSKAEFQLALRSLRRTQNIPSTPNFEVTE